MNSRVSSTAQSPVPSPQSALHGDESEEDEGAFVYPGIAATALEPVAAPDSQPPTEAAEEPAAAVHLAQSTEDDEPFVYPAASEQPSHTSDSIPHSPLEQSPEPEPQSVSSEAAEGEQPTEDESPEPIPKSATSHPTPAQLESLIAASSSGDLSLLQNLFRNALRTGEVEPFALANDASTRSGLTALHVSASRGYLEVVKWCKSQTNVFGAKTDTILGSVVVEECGAMPDIEDKEGEVRGVTCVSSAGCSHDLRQTALHKAALHGHLSIVRYLLPERADVQAQDADGWTALHNACSKVIPHVACCNFDAHGVAGRVIWTSLDGYVSKEERPQSSAVHQAWIFGVKVVGPH